MIGGGKAELLNIYDNRISKVIGSTFFTRSWVKNTEQKQSIGDFTTSNTVYWFGKRAATIVLVDQTLHLDL
jgi:uncharacterized membrane protein